MKKMSSVIIILLIVIVGVLIFLFSDRNNKKGELEGVSTQEETPSETKSETNLYVGEDFTIARPENWIQTHLQSTLVSFQNTSESYPEGSAPAKVNFKSYVAVSFDNTQANTIEEISSLVKQQIQAVIPGASFGSKIKETISGQPAVITEIDLRQQDIDFKVLMGIIMKEDKYFTISANTTTQKWPEYGPIFYDMIRSFRFKE
jgi:hypothetical protein